MRPGARALILTEDAMTVGQFMDAARQAGVVWLSLAETIHDAMQHCAYGGHSLAVIDRDLGAADGMDFVRAIRRASEHPSRRMPVIVVSERTGSSDLWDAEALGVNAYIEKPISVAMLSRRIAQVFDDEVAAPPA